MVGANKGGNVQASCYASGKVTGTAVAIGGVAGSTSESGTIAACYANGIISGKNNVGGVVGTNSSGKVIASYWHGTATHNYTGADVEVDAGIGASLGTAAGTAPKVTETGEEGTVTWDKALENLNGSENTFGYMFGGTMDDPTLTKN